MNRDGGERISTGGVDPQDETLNLREEKSKRADVNERISGLINPAPSAG